MCTVQGYLYSQRPARMVEKWLVVGISGVTCGGKTTLAAQLNKLFPQSKVISQDDYFLHVDDKRHVWISELNHINFDILASLDMEQMHSDIETFLSDKIIARRKDKQRLISGTSDLQKCALNVLGDSSTKLLIIEGFCIFNYPPIERFCQLKYFFELERDECSQRRSKRVYDPPDCPGYFEACVWPEYLKQLDEVQVGVKNVTFFNEYSTGPMESVLSDIIDYVL